MATTVKRWRTIIVGSNPYRWMVKREPKYWDNHLRTTLRFTVESASGALLVVVLNRPRLDYWWPEPGEELRPVTPNEAENEIRIALQQGWQSDVKTKPFFRSAR